MREGVRKVNLVHSSFESHNLIGPDEVIDFP